ncbi:YjgP/YjgQ family permease [candidate division KSB1 bacterium]|nr:YjgP/YjgQ family permease [candidate division KSB1 bacterium]NIR72972.1 YjgP/YjgQ family permease [candidate division KSB1 bacterium]NIS23778.1 YjgP/YjgQ family permease [candidate division KSB1 bacterium]NIT70697.1 YjgP/YjgQ family permease [candidate division KSB1 bacterium]NIU24428.1 YjgP/YjgQ family permease [candidate division KSB1 bacterium]
MLRILPLYLIREHVGPFFLALVVIKLLFILNVLYRDLGKFLSKGISFPVIVEFLFLNLAWMIALSVPMAVLTATIMAFGRLAADNEITAIRASGISLYQIFIPLVLLATLVAAGLIWFNNNVLPDFNHKARLLATDITRKKPMINLDPGIIYSEIPNYNILVQKVEEQDSVSYVENVIIDDQSESNLIKTITAKRGEICFHEHTGLLEIKLFNGEMHEVNIDEPDRFTKWEFPKHIIKIPLSEMLLIRTQSEYRGDREKSAAALLESVQKNREKMEERKKRINKRIHEYLDELNNQLNANAGTQKHLRNLINDYQQLARQIQLDLDMIKSYEKSSDIFLVEYHKKYSIPTACIVFVLVGAPLGILIRKRGWAVAGSLSLGFFLIYWAFLIGGEILADRQIVSPFLAMWSPNIIVGALGIFLVLRTVREI